MFSSVMWSQKMFEGLDQINWASLGFHVYRENEKIPDEIRNLLSSDPEVRDQARAVLLGWGQDYADIYDTTPHIIPFIIEILNNPDGPGKDALLDHLSSKARKIRDFEKPSVRTMRLHIKTYDSLKSGLHTYISLLNDHSK